MDPAIAAWLAGAFLLGSASAGDLVPRLWGVDIRERGDGNPGAHNVAREVGLPAAVAVLALDVASGAAATVAPLWLGWGIEARAASMVAVLLGHMFSPWWRFRGGVGGAVAIGTTFGLLPAGALLAALLTVAALVVTRTAIYAVWTFFGVCLVAGAVLDRDVAGLGAVLAAMLLPTMRWGVRFAITSREALRHWRASH